MVMNYGGTWFTCQEQEPPLNVYVWAQVDGDKEMPLAYTGHGWFDVKGMSWQEGAVTGWKPVTVTLEVGT